MFNKIIEIYVHKLVRNIMLGHNRATIAIIIFFFSVITIYLCFCPLVISIDSIYGFLAYNGTLQTGHFNSLQEVSPDNVAIVKNHFVAWWSPGQWILPGLISFFTGCKIGVSSIIITVCFSILGLWGFYTLFTYFGFSQPITFLSLLVIELSDFFYGQFIIYQGGEVLSFGIFPWFLLFMVTMKNLSWNKSLLFLVFFLGCFIAKTTLVVYCSIIVFYKMFEGIGKRNNNTFYPTGLYKVIWLGALCVGCCILLNFFYLRKGPSIAFINQFTPELSDILIPFSSPLSSLLSAQTIIFRIQKMLVANRENDYIALVVYLLLWAASIVVLYSVLKRQKISSSYLLIFIFLYVGVALFFVTGYLFNANIDKNIRHFKLVGCLFVPLCLSLVKKPAIIKMCIFLFAVYSLFDFAYLKNKWSKNRYISKNYFFRNYYNLSDVDSVDEKTYKKIIALDTLNPLQVDGYPVIFFLEGNPDIAIDIKHPTVFETEDAQLGLKEYRGAHAIIFVIISKKTFYATPDILKRLLPSYTEFRKIDETGSYLFFRSE